MKRPTLPQALPLSGGAQNSAGAPVRRTRRGGGLEAER